MKAMLATDTTVGSFKNLVLDGRWWLEPKYDGIRTLVHVNDGVVSWTNRNGVTLTKPTPEAAEAALEKMPGHFTIDGELVEGRLFAFDLPRLTSTLEHVKLEDRRRALEGVLRLVGCDVISASLIAEDKDDKEFYLHQALNDNWEGVMLKDRTGPYLFGKRSKFMLKMKFTHTVDCIVSEVHSNGKENAGLSVVVREDGLRSIRKVGACSLIGKEPIDLWDVVEVRFLYVSEDGHLVQPRMVRKRTDKLPEECTIDQLDGMMSIKQPKGY